MSSSATPALLSGVRNSTNVPPQPDAKFTATSGTTAPSTSRSSSNSSTPVSSSPSTSRKFIAPKSSPYRFVSGKTTSKFDDLKGLSVSLPGESDLLEVNKSFIAFPITGPGGRIAVLSANKPGRLPPRIPCVLCGTDVTDFKWNPFNHNELVTASDDGKLRVWQISSEGLSDDDLTQPSAVLSAHTNRINLIKFHPTVSNVILTTEVTIPHADQVLSAAFSTNGALIATAGRDKTVRVFDARTGSLMTNGPSHDGIKGCRLVWLDNEFLCTIGFGRGSQREIRLYKAGNLSSPIATTKIDTSPSLLTPHYDEDAGLLYLAGRGENYILIFEIAKDGTTPTGITFLTRFDAPGSSIQQGAAFLPKRYCDVKIVEVLKGWRLTQTNIEELSFTVPRLKKEFFQDDLFPRTRDVETPAYKTFEDWVAATEPLQAQPTIDLLPSDMTPLSQAPVETKVERKVQTFVREVSDAEMKENMMTRMLEQAQLVSEEKLPQEEMEGVDESEWDD
ncbi:Coronin-7 [Quaeritorhiza haematococci]|nr:Coronin-7 [Quaeritorhiza haematococci]